MLDAVRVLERAKEILDDPNSWCKRIDAMNEEGQAVAPSHPTAVKWCLRGAVIRAINEQAHSELPWLGGSCACPQCRPLASPEQATMFNHIMYCLAQSVPGHEGELRDPVGYNDSRASHEDILLMLKRTIHNLT